MFEIETNWSTLNSDQNEIKIKKCDLRHKIVKKTLQFYFQIYIISNANIKQNDSFIKRIKNEVRMKIKRVCQMYKLNKMNINLKNKANDHLNLQILHHWMIIMKVTVRNKNSNCFKTIYHDVQRWSRCLNMLWWLQLSNDILKRL